MLAVRTAQMHVNAHDLMLLPEDGVDLQVRRPELLLDLVGRSMLEVGKGQVLADVPVPDAD